MQKKKKKRAQSWENGQFEKFFAAVRFGTTVKLSLKLFWHWLITNLEAISNN